MFNKLKSMWVVSCTLLLLPISNLMGNENSDQTLRVAAQFFLLKGVVSLDPPETRHMEFSFFIVGASCWTDTAGTLIHKEHRRIMGGNKQ